MSTATVQMNVRLPRGLKEAGDAALASAGVSPTEAVRALWARAADRGQGLEEVLEVLRGRPREAASDAALERAQSIVPDGLAELGVVAGAEAASNEPSYAEIRELAWAERLAERGLA